MLLILTYGADLLNKKMRGFEVPLIVVLI